MNEIQYIEPQQEKPKPTRGRGRPSESFKDKMIEDANGEKLEKIHKAMAGKKGKDAALIILAAVDLGWLLKPTYTQVKNEFGDIGSSTGYNRYLTHSKFTNEEIENLLNTLEIKWQSEWSEIQSSVIWDDVLELLKDKYPVPYVRFSSVYKSFSTLDDFKQLIW